jgi:hypothetical protein
MSWVVMDTTPVLKERGYKNGYNHENSHRADSPCTRVLESVKGITVIFHSTAKPNPYPLGEGRV